MISDFSLVDTAALLIHGFGGEPFEMLGLAEALESFGCKVSVPLLPGHGTSIADWRKSSFSDLTMAMEQEFDALVQSHERVLVCGLSMGGTLALHLGIVREPAGVLTIAAPVHLFQFWPPEFPDWRMPLVPLLKHIRPVWPTGSPDPKARRIAPWKGYEEYVSLEALDSFLDGMRQVKMGLSKLEAPLLCVHSPCDRTVPLSSAYAIMSGVSSLERRLELLPIHETVTKHHVLTTHEETRDRVQELVEGFALKQLAE
ncbi:alpha/beta hydrolase [Desulfovibrio ferrophilus]|uniref:Putative carboxylesterase n=1 Tax=Desulfovibrio ferrophilus TaxID=241368 RepID=A0A2Z6AWH8_9BACT|nr:alpha/beta fold hydrolase [Desulfovibrio ferrophilus]BBD07602.1 putative carboxylesterase [Desulfovibrio ferrophilus]